MILFCECGCGNELEPLDKYGRSRKFIHGHNKGNLKYCLLNWKKPCACGCGEMIPILREDRRLSKFKLGHANKGKFLEKNPNWRGGITYIDGYRMIYKPDYKNSNAHGYVFEHRLVMEQFLQRDLEPDEIVHHKNGDKLDNRIKNLKVLTISEHSSHHRQQEIREGRFSGIINIMKYNNSRSR